MPDDPELRRIIDNGIAKGYSDDDIRLLTQEHRRRVGAPATDRSEPLNANDVSVLGMKVPLPTAVSAPIAAWGRSGPKRVHEGFSDIASGEKSRGARKVMAGAIVTAFPMLAPTAAKALIAAPVATAAAAGGGAVGGALASSVGETAAKSLGATVDQAGLVGDVAGIAGGAAGGMLASKAATAIGKGLTEVLPERLYGQIFKTAEEDVRRAYVAQSNGRLPDPSLARKAIEERLMGTSEQMAAYSIEQLNALEGQLQAKAGREILVMPDKAKYVSLLDSLAKQFDGGFFSPRASDARALIQSLQSMPGPSARATDMLTTRRFLDGLRNTSSFKLDPTLTMKQEELKIAADQIRGVLHRRPGLSPLIQRERTFIQALDAVVADATKRGNRQVFGLVDAVLTQAGPAGAAAAVVRHGAMLPSVVTTVAQGLTRAGRMTRAAESVPLPHAAAVGAVSGASTR